MYNRSVLIVSPDGQEQTIDTSPPSTVEPMRLGFVNKNHYVSLVKDAGATDSCPDNEPNKKPASNGSVLGDPEIQSVDSTRGQYCQSDSEMAVSAEQDAQEQPRPKVRI